MSFFGYHIFAIFFIGDCEILSKNTLNINNLVVSWYSLALCVPGIKDVFDKIYGPFAYEEIIIL